MRTETDHFIVVEHDEDCDTRALCECGRGYYHSCEYSSCYQCFLDRRADYVTCVYCDRWHSPEFDTCFSCRPQGRDEAARDLKIMILARDSFQCGYCGAREGEEQVDPRLVRPKCLPDCVAGHNHRRPCKPGCARRHRHRKEGEPGTCRPDCSAEHRHLAKDDDGIRPVRLHVDHIQPCSKDGTADPWNLQALCGVCNIGKSDAWWQGSRHHARRRLVMANYMISLWDFLTPDQQEDLTYDAQFDGLSYEQAARLVVSDYVSRVKACRPRPVVPGGVVVEDVPPEYAHLDLPPARLAVGQ